MIRLYGSWNTFSTAPCLSLYRFTTYMLMSNAKQLPLGIFVVEPRLAMRELLVTLLPGIVALCYFWGWGIIVNIIVAVTTAVVSEAVILKIRGIAVMPILEGLQCDSNCNLIGTCPSSLSAVVGCGRRYGLCYRDSKTVIRWSRQ